MAEKRKLTRRESIIAAASEDTLEKVDVMGRFRQAMIKEYGKEEGERKWEELRAVKVGLRDKEGGLIGVGMFVYKPETDRIGKGIMVECRVNRVGVMEAMASGHLRFCRVREEGMWERGFDGQLESVVGEHNWQFRSIPPVV